jgi:hypothetical protein
VRAEARRSESRGEEDRKYGIGKRKREEKR